MLPANGKTAVAQHGLQKHPIIVDLVKVPPNRIADMNHAEQQHREELNVFERFAHACPLPLLVDTAANRPEPEPDVLCDLTTGEKVAFELGQAEDVTAYKNAKGETYVASVQKLDSDGGSTFATVAPAVVDRVANKLTKEYRTDHPIHLVVWSMTASVAEVDFWREEFAGLIQSKGMRPFERIWVFGYGESTIVFDSNQMGIRNLQTDVNVMADQVREV